MTSQPNLQSHIDRLKQLGLSADESNWFELVPTAIDEIERLRETLPSSMLTKPALQSAEFDGACAAALEAFADCANAFGAQRSVTSQAWKTADDARALVRTSIEQLEAFISRKRTIS